MHCGLHITGVKQSDLFHSRKFCLLTRSNSFSFILCFSNDYRLDHFEVMSGPHVAHRPLFGIGKIETSNFLFGKEDNNIMMFCCENGGHAPDKPLQFRRQRKPTQMLM